MSLLPLKILFIVSDLMFFILYRVLHYRKSVVYKNIRSSFPDKTPKEIKHIQKAFFVHLCDLVVENIKLFSISHEEARDRFKLVNPEVFEKLYDQNRSVVMVSGHYNNWELAAVAFDGYTTYKTICIYTPLSDKFFDQVFAQMRTKYGLGIVQKGLVPRSFITNKNDLTVTIFAADQSPTYSKKVHWTNFLNQETAVHIGTELFAVKYNYPVVYLKIHKIKRGYYQGVLELLHENPAETKDGEITDLHTRCLEKEIMNKPQYWLWSHKRWKRKKTDTERKKELSAVTAA